MGISQSPEFLADLGLEQSPAKSTMSDGNAKRDYRVFEDLYYNLCKHYKDNRCHRYKCVFEVISMEIVNITEAKVSNRQHSL